MPTSNRFSLLLKAFSQLGLEASFHYGWYQFKRRSGLLWRQTPTAQPLKPDSDLIPRALPISSDVEQIRALLGDSIQQLFDEANAIVQGRVRLFGEEQPLTLGISGPLDHWTAYERSLPDGGDIKLVWEMGRFAWATTLARAYALSGDEAYAESFWDYASEFIAANPPNQGPHWSSAQEVALRLIHLAFAYSLFAASPKSTPQLEQILAGSLAVHAERIPPSLAYARAQDNNHLLSEALGLYTAGLLLPEHPKAETWRNNGRGIFLHALDDQISQVGVYTQHSSNYQRLMLSLALWADFLFRLQGENWPEQVRRKLASATRWLLQIMDRRSGRAANLGPNDGAYVLPLTVQNFADYRPVLAAASSAFFGSQPFNAGPWDELGIWLNTQKSTQMEIEEPSDQPIRLESGESWAYLRSARFTSRPGHADQLHLDLWSRGVNIALDAGSYRYTAPAPWDNALSATRSHNTVIIANRDQMTRAGRFLWLDWAQAEVLELARNAKGGTSRAIAQHNGYRRVGFTHRRSVEASDGRWLVLDQVLGRGSTQARLHWLLPDHPWHLDGNKLKLEMPEGEIALSVESSLSSKLSLIRGGELLQGPGPSDPILGWISPIYATRLPALSLILSVEGTAPFTFTSTWSLSK